MNGFDDFYEEDRRGNEMVAIASHCPGFSRRGDFDVFNMSTYQSCENCRHLSADDSCAYRKQDYIFPME